MDTQPQQPNHPITYCNLGEIDKLIHRIETAIWRAMFREKRENKLQFIYIITYTVCTSYYNDTKESGYLFTAKFLEWTFNCIQYPIYGTISIF